MYLFKTNKQTNYGLILLMAYPDLSATSHKAILRDSREGVKGKNAGYRLNRPAASCQLCSIRYTWWMFLLTSLSFCSFTWKIESVHCTTRLLTWHFTWPSVGAGHPSAKFRQHILSKLRAQCDSFNWCGPTAAPALRLILPDPELVSDWGFWI